MLGIEYVEFNFNGITMVIGSYRTTEEYVSLFHASMADKNSLKYVV